MYSAGLFYAAASAKAGATPASGTNAYDPVKAAPDQHSVPGRPPARLFAMRTMQGFFENNA